MPYHIPDVRARFVQGQIQPGRSLNDAPNIDTFIERLRSRIINFLVPPNTLPRQVLTTNYVGRFNKLPSANFPGQLILAISFTRHQARIINFGSGPAFISNRATVTENDYPLDPGAELPNVINWSNTIYAIGEHADLRVWESSE